MYKWGEIKKHKDFDHRSCHFCNKKFYDLDSLYKHFRNKHYQCDLCKKQGKKKRDPKTGLIEFELYRDIYELKKHYKKRHSVCKKMQCSDLVFENQAELARHYLYIHNE